MKTKLRSRLVTGASLLALILAAACKAKQEAPIVQGTDAPASRVAESRAVVEKTAGAEISVELDDGWDPAFVAKQAVSEIAVCRDVMSSRLGIEPDANAVLKVDYVHESRKLESLSTAEPRSEWTLYYGTQAFLRPMSKHLVFARDAEIRVRAYMLSLALLLIQPTVAPVCFVDSVAFWNASLVLNRLRGEPLWTRGRAWSDFSRAFTRDPELGDIDVVCEWGSSPLVTSDDLSAPTRDRELLLSLRLSPASADPRTLSCFFVYFLATYDVGPDGRMRFAVTPKYESVLNALIRKGSPADVRAHCRGLSSKAGVSYAEFASYFRFVRRKIRLGHARNGVILAWDEFVNSRGDRTGEPDDDLVR